MKVLALTISYPTADEPVAGVFVREHVEAARAHAEVEVVHLERADVRRIEVEHDEGAWRVRYPLWPAAAWHLAAAALGLRLVRDHDLVHAHFFLAGLPAVLFQRRPVVVSEHWSIFLPEDPMRLGVSGRVAARVAFSRAAFVLPVSAALQRAIETHGVRARFRVVPNVVDMELFRPDGGTREGLLAVGLHYEAKGFDVLIDALARLPDERLRLVGDGPLRSALEAQATRLGIIDRVEFLGTLPKTEIAELMRRARLVVVPSRFETSGVVAIEALASGAPIVATRTGALPELVAEGGGTLVPPDDPAALADAIRAEPAQVNERIRERHSRASVASELDEIYRAVASPR